MIRVLIYGAGQTGEQILHNIKNECDIIGFLDGNKEKKGMFVDGVPIVGGVEMLQEVCYDKVYIGTTFWEPVKELLLANGVSESDIVVDLPEDLGSPIRSTWLECYSKLLDFSEYAVAEGGVFRGDFAAVINRSFPKSKLYLFDTFEGFDHRDIEIEEKNSFSKSKEHQFRNTSVELVMSKMNYPENVEIRKGFFPKTATGIEESFAFVNLDFDLYQPILEGLRLFYPKMIKGGVILIHDYYHVGLSGVREAIRDFEKEVSIPIVKMPIGDNQSIAIIAL